MLKAAGFNSFPKDTDAFLKMMKALKDKSTPGGFALGHATGDAKHLVSLAGMVVRRQDGG